MLALKSAGPETGRLRRAEPAHPPHRHQGRGQPVADHHRPIQDGGGPGVPAAPDACATIQAQTLRRAHLAQFRGWKDEEWLLCSEHGGMLLYDNVHRAFKASLKRAAVPAPSGRTICG